MGCDQIFFGQTRWIHQKWVVAIRNIAANHVLNFMPTLGVVVHELRVAAEHFALYHFTQIADVCLSRHSTHLRPMPEGIRQVQTPVHALIISFIERQHIICNVHVAIVVNPLWLHDASASKHQLSCLLIVITPSVGHWYSTHDFTGSRIVTSSSAAVGCIPTVASKSALVAPAFIATAKPCVISAASKPHT